MPMMFAAPPTLVPTPANVAALDRLGDEIAELSGELSYAKVRALTRVATPETEERLLQVGRCGTAAHVERIVRAWRYVDRKAEVRDTARRHAARSLRLSQDADGMWVLRGRLEPEVGALLHKALAAAREQLYQRGRQETAAASPNAAPVPPTTTGPDPASTPVPDPGWDRGGPMIEPAVPYEHQQADALALLAGVALRHELDPGAPGERYQVVVHVDAAVLADPDRPGQSVLEDAGRVSAETSQRLACDASRVVMRHDAAGRTVEVGARTRTIPPAIRRALHHRDRGCRFPGCTVRVGEGHHVRHWAQGGPTPLSNLATLCRRHHRAVHEEGFQVERLPDGALRFRTPHGHSLPDVPAPPRIPADPLSTLRAQNEAQGLRLHGRTTCAEWLGERLDVGYAIDVRHPRARGPAGAPPASPGPPAPLE